MNFKRIILILLIIILNLSGFHCSKGKKINTNNINKKKITADKKIQKKKRHYITGRQACDNAEDRFNRLQSSDIFDWIKCNYTKNKFGQHIYIVIVKTYSQDAEDWIDVSAIISYFIVQADMKVKTKSYYTGIVIKSKISDLIFFFKYDIPKSRQCIRRYKDQINSIICMTKWAIDKDVIQKQVDMINQQ